MPARSSAVMVSSPPTVTVPGVPVYSMKARAALLTLLLDRMPPMPLPESP
jgi:hypothetical protein